MREKRIFPWTEKQKSFGSGDAVVIKKGEDTPRETKHQNSQPTSTL
jgi:hypothetical protein